MYLSYFEQWLQIPFCFVWEKKKESVSNSMKEIQRKKRERKVYIPKVHHSLKRLLLLDVRVYLLWFDLDELWPRDFRIKMAFLHWVWSKPILLLLLFLKKNPHPYSVVAWVTRGCEWEIERRGIGTLTLYWANREIQSRAVTCNLNFPVFENFPKHVPKEINFSLGIEVACFTKFSET